jgi:hypothetical protein
MSKAIRRRDVLTLLPALALSAGNPKVAMADGPTSSILINAADSLFHYRNLLETVRGDAFEEAAKGTIHAVEACNTALEKLRGAVTQLAQHLHSQPNWPRLQQRFATLDKSLALAEGDRPDQEKAEAVRALPQTLAALRELMQEISKACNDDPDGAIAALLDHVYSQIQNQNQMSLSVDDNKTKWADWNAQISTSYSKCAAGMDDAALIITESSRDTGDWLAHAMAALESAVSALEDMRTIMQQIKAAEPSTISARSTDDLSSVDSLRMILSATSKSLSKGVDAIHTKHVSYGRGGTLDTRNQPPAVDLSQSDLGLIGRVQQLVHQTDPRLFSPGVETQTINCIAACWPIWIVYNSNSEDDRKNRVGLIGSVVAFGLIRGTVREMHAQLKMKLQSLYLDTVQSEQA